MSLAQAYARLQAGDLAGAEAMLTTIIAGDARNTEALHMRAVARHQRGDLAGALADLDVILDYPPDHADTRFNRGSILLQMKRREEALSDFERATELAPRDAGIWLSRAAAERELGRDDSAVESYSAALRLDPRNAGALSDRAASYGRLERFDEALRDLDQALKADPKNAAAHANRGKTLTQLERYPEAAMAFERAVAFDATRGGAWNNYALVLAALGRAEEAASAFDRAAAAPVRDFDAGHPLYNKGLMRLARGDYAEGFALYARRITLGVTPKPASADSVPEWSGEALEGPLRIWCEQGAGDQILFTRLLPLVLERAPNVMVDCDPRLAPLLQRAHPALKVEPLGASFFGAAAQIGMGDLPAALKVAPADIVQLPPILRADESKVATIRARYADLARGRPIIGVAWASPRAKGARPKTAALSHWGALLKQPYFFVSLQYDPGDDIADANAPIYRDDSIDQMRSMEDFAAQIAALDYVVSTSNTTVHVAGALGVPALVLVPPGRGLHWYWGFKGETTPWYPSLRLVRRALGAPWDGQVAEAAALLGETLAHAG